MRIVLQRISEASVEVDGEIVGSAGRGILILLGAGTDDSEEQAS